MLRAVVPSPEGLVSKSAFTDWIKKFDPEDIVGTSANAIDCPIARYLRDAAGMQAGVVSKGFYFCPQHIYELPEWAKAFVLAVDCDMPLNVPARLALEVLNEDCKGFPDS